MGGDHALRSDSTFAVKAQHKQTKKKQQQHQHWQHQQEQQQQHQPQATLTTQTRTSMSSKKLSVFERLLLTAAKSFIVQVDTTLRAIATARKRAGAWSAFEPQVAQARQHMAHARAQLSGHCCAQNASGRDLQHVVETCADTMMATVIALKPTVPAVNALKAKKATLVRAAMPVASERLCRRSILPPSIQRDQPPVAATIEVEEDCDQHPVDDTNASCIPTKNGSDSEDDDDAASTDSSSFASADGDNQDDDQDVNTDDVGSTAVAALKLELEQQRQVYEMRLATVEANSAFVKTTLERRLEDQRQAFASQLALNASCIAALQRQLQTQRESDEARLEEQTDQLRACKLDADKRVAAITEELSDELSGLRAKLMMARIEADVATNFLEEARADLAYERRHGVDLEAKITTLRLEVMRIRDQKHSAEFAHRVCVKKLQLLVQDNKDKQQLITNANVNANANANAEGKYDEDVQYIDWSDYLRNESTGCLDTDRTEMEDQETLCIATALLRTLDGQRSHSNANAEASTSEDVQYIDWSAPFLNTPSGRVDTELMHVEDQETRHIAAACFRNLEPQFQHADAADNASEDVEYIQW